MKRRDTVLVGLLLIVAVAVGVLGTIWLVRGGLSQGYPLYARFPWGAGLKQGQPVLLAGVNVGYVAEVELDPNGTIVATMAIDDEYGIPIGSTATVVPVGIFGDQAIALTPPRASAQYIAHGDTLTVGPSAPSMGELLARGDSVARNVQALTAEFERQLVTEGGLRDLRNAMASTNALIARLGQIAAEQSRQLTLTQTTLRRSVAALDSTAIDSTLQNLRATSANMAALTGSLQQTTTQLNGVLASLEGTDGTAGKLLHDPALYDNLQRLVARIDSLTADFQKHPRKYINLEIF
ncbi:MAG TPA: MlaD family protein [Gemmatimonadaceae bacterium]|nr:MlaD family protein [Gemmatimonadaceae bacterium]